MAKYKHIPVMPTDEELEAANQCCNDYFSKGYGESWANQVDFIAGFIIGIYYQKHKELPKKLTPHKLNIRHKLKKKIE